MVLSREAVVFIMYLYSDEGAIRSYGYPTGPDFFSMKFHREPIGATKSLRVSQPHFSYSRNLGDSYEFPGWSQHPRHPPAYAAWHPVFGSEEWCGGWMGNWCAYHIRKRNTSLFFPGGMLRFVWVSIPSFFWQKEEAAAKSSAAEEFGTQSPLVLLCASVSWHLAIIIIIIMPHFDDNNIIYNNNTTTNNM